MPIDYNKIQPIIEAYTCIQTEGSMAGRPNFLIRTTGCTHRCYFGEGGFCDSWYTSIHPEKGSWTLSMIKELFLNNIHIKSLMISGGSPTMHPVLVNELINLFKEIQKDGFVTLETEGSHFIQTDIPIDLISLSPKFNNSIPVIGTKTPLGDDVDQKMINQHSKYRMNHAAIQEMINYHIDYHFKPVVDRYDLTIWKEIETFRIKHFIPTYKVWVMPAGDTLERLQPNYSYVMEECIERGYNFTGRAHIVAYGDRRGV
jgi:7-carboxy-7-deazaguanine synthase